MRNTVLSVVDCSNPGILISDCDDHVDHEGYFQQRDEVAYSFEEVKLGPYVVGYRSDLIPCGQGWSGYRHARLFELRDGKLVVVFELEGPFLFVAESAIEKEKRYRLLHWVGDDPRTAVYQYYRYENGKYVKTKNLVQ